MPNTTKVSQVTDFFGGADIITTSISTVATRTVLDTATERKYFLFMLIAPLVTAFLGLLFWFYVSCRTYINIEEINFTDTKAARELTMLAKQHKLTRLSDFSKIYKDIVRVVLNTWQFENRLGRDAIGLDHTGIEVQYILRVTSPVKQPKAKHTLPTVYSPDIEKHQIKTKEVLTHYDNASFVPYIIISSSSASVHNSQSVIVGGDSLHVHSAVPTILTAPLHRQDRLGCLTQFQDDSEGLNPDDMYLFHGTKVSNLDGILTNNFDLQFAKNGMYGKAIYFAECSEKADQYADCRTNRRTENLTMLLTKVHLGRVYIHDPEQCKQDRKKAKRDKVPYSVLAGQGKRFREFLIFDPKQCEVKYIIVYKRIKSAVQEAVV